MRKQEIGIKIKSELILFYWSLSYSPMSPHSMLCHPSVSKDRKMYFQDLVVLNYATLFIIKFCFLLY